MRALYGVARQRVHGDVNLTGEAYGSVGQPGRRPGSSWRAQVSPRIDLGFGISATADALFSSEGTQLRQNINQAGFNPEWSWGKLYLGDFSRPLTQYTVQGVRSRGAGLDLRFGGWQANVQTGRTQRAVSRPGDQLVFERRLSAGNLEWRHGSGLGVGVSVAHAKDNPNSVERNLLIADSLALDSLVADTLLDPFRPRPQASTRPQENLVGGLALELPLFRQTLRLKGEVAGALLSSDITRPRIADGAGGALDVLDPLMPLRLSTHGDVAWNGEAQLALGGVSLRGQVERIGPGYTSLGLGYLIGDRRSWMLGGAVPFLGARGTLSLQAQRMADNVLGQKTFTPGRDHYVAAISVRPVESVSLSANALYNLVGNDAPDDSLRRDVRMLSLNTGAGLTHGVFGRRATTTLAWTFQRTDDAAPRPLAPDVTVQNVTVSEQVNLTDAIALAPSLSWAVTAPAGGTAQRNAFVGFRAQARGWKDRLNSSATLSRTFTAGRQVTAARVQATWQLPYEASLLLQGRWNAYSAFATRPAFRESFLTLAMSRPF
ncbi:MAG: hypothetical protein ACK6AH_09170 [Gemmatimonadota bacterium]